jgi:hypothetical protein
MHDWVRNIARWSLSSTHDYGPRYLRKNFGMAGRLFLQWGTRQNANAGRGWQDLVGDVCHDTVPPSLRC